MNTKKPPSLVELPDDMAPSCSASVSSQSVLSLLALWGTSSRYSNLCNPLYPVNGTVSGGTSSTRCS